MAVKGPGDFQLVTPVDLVSKAVARRRRRFRRAQSKTRPCDIKNRQPVQPCPRTRFNGEDYRVVREIVDRYCPPVVPNGGKRYFKGPFDLFEALCIYAMAVEYGWQRDDMALHLGRSLQVQKRLIAYIEDLRELRRFAFIDRICELAREQCRALI